MATANSRQAKRREYYLQNQGSERRKARDRAKRRAMSLSPQDLDRHKQNHCEAQARYRERNRALLAVRAVAYRLRKKRDIAIEKDEEEYQRLWNQASEENQEMQA